MTGKSESICNTDAAPEGRRDWDWVSMEDYDKDTKDLVNTSAAIIRDQKHLIDQLTLLVSLLVYYGKRIEIPNYAFTRGLTLTTIREVNEEHDITVFRRPHDTTNQ